MSHNRNRTHIERVQAQAKAHREGTGTGKGTGKGKGTHIEFILFTFECGHEVWDRIQRCPIGRSFGLVLHGLQAEHNSCQFECEHT